jgi:LmbE family N-acetylglucosaminyl deacetylase
MMLRFLLCLMLALGLAGAAAAQDEPLPDDPARFLFIGAHPDDADLKAGGTAALLAGRGHAVKFLSVTNGDAGHQTMGGGALAKRRRAEAQEAARRLGITYEVLDFHDGELLPTLDARRAIIRAIRAWDADVVVSHRPNDYHPDHRYSGILVQDAAILVEVPQLLTSTPALDHNPVFLYFEDSFQKPNPFTPDIALDVGPVYDTKLRALDAHVSQFHEYLPSVAEDMGTPPEDEAERLAWLKLHWTFPITEPVREALARWYGPAHAAQVGHAEAFEVAEYGTQPSEAMIRRLFSMPPR